MSNKRFHKHLTLLMAVFGGLYSIISIVNHYNFRTYALDLGLYTNALYKYSHFSLADSIMIKQISEPLLGGHFDIYLILLCPLSFIFGSYTLLIIQILAILLGGLGVFNLMCKKHPDQPWIHLGAALYFYTFFAVLSALSYDYHSVVVAACVVPWFFYTIHIKKYLSSFFLLILVVISQENTSLWMAFVCLGLAIEYRSDLRT